MFSFLARLIVLLIAVSMVRSVINVIRRLWAGQQHSRPMSRVNYASNAPTSGSTNELQQDPVCGTYVPVETSLRKIVRGKVFHFCSAECRDRFSA